MNQKRDYVASIEKNYSLSVRVEGDINLVTPEYSIEKLKSATRILSENEPALITADGLMELSEEDVIEDLKNEEEKPKKRRKRRRKKKQFSNGEGVNSNFEDTEEDTSSESSLAETSPSNKNSSSKQNDIAERKNQNERLKKDDNLDSVSNTLAEEVADIANSELKREDATDKGNLEVEPKDRKEEKKRPAKKKRTQKQIIENSDNNGKEDYEENSKQKRKGWWSLNG